MGINISLYKIISIEKQTTWGGKECDFCETELIKSFDYGRYSGDREFMSESEKWRSLDSEAEYIRPVDINERREWVKENVYEGNQERLLKGLDLIEQDEMVGFHVSY